MNSLNCCLVHSRTCSGTNSSNQFRPTISSRFQPRIRTRWSLQNVTLPSRSSISAAIRISSSSARKRRSLSRASCVAVRASSITLSTTPAAMPSGNSVATTAAFGEVSPL